AERLLAGWEAERTQLRQQRQHLAEEAQAIRSAWRTQQEEAHARELEVNDLRHRRESICARLLEDYQLDLAALYHEEGPPGSEPARTEPSTAPLPEQEMEELRRKLSRLGSVNLEAIQELTELEARASSLQIQFEDLNAAQKALQDIISRINSDSRRLFSETYA